MSSLLRFLPSRRQQRPAQDTVESDQGPGLQDEKASQSQNPDQDKTSISSNGKNDGAIVEESDLVSPGHLTLQEGECSLRHNAIAGYL